MLRAMAYWKIQIFFSDPSEFRNRIIAMARPSIEEQLLKAELGAHHNRLYC